ncbi:U-box domain-containing protein 4-like [Pyrus ussuriensis x Pyrus communis]|uniref:U-box domain-containing protein 4-like n=1 Tax=Pyrus ussuriensis x Pyrus communis TaxID=2448454 RepID=A0A5N5FCD5_9ROSA|nr:U-box domain-containing protein 4-like [Pyrus ussuriensis x Pyrus communis]
MDEGSWPCIRRGLVDGLDNDRSGELKRLASLPSPENALTSELSKAAPELEPCQGFLQRENFSTKIIESISPEDLQATIKIYVDGLQSSSLVVKQSVAAKLRLLAKNQVDNHASIANPWTHEHAITAYTQVAKFQLGFEHGRKKRMDARGRGKGEDDEFGGDRWGRRLRVMSLKGGLGEDKSRWDLGLGWGKMGGGKKGEWDKGWVPM